MSRFKTCAVVDIETNNVIAQFRDEIAINGVLKVNDLILKIVEDDEVVLTKKVKLSTAKEVIGKIVSVFKPPRCIPTDSSFTDMFGEADLFLTIW